MSTNTIIGIVVGAVVVIGGGYYVMTHTAPASQQEEVATNAGSPTAMPAQGGAFTGSTAELAARAGDWRCAVQAGTDKSVSSGVTYVSGGKVRGDFTTSVQGYGNVESHMIADGTYVYTWSSMMSQGFKMMQTSSGSGSGATQGQSFDSNHSYSYDCQPWSADQSKFAVPTNITFMTAPTR